MATLCAGVLGVLFVAVTHPIAEGRDKFYYLSQLSSVVGSGQLAYDTTAVGWLGIAVPLSMLFPADLALKATVLLVVGLLLVMTARSVTELSGSTGAGILAVAWLATSRLLTPLVTEFVAELVGLALFAAVSRHFIHHGRVTGQVLLLGSLCTVVHRSAAIWSAVLIATVWIYGIRSTGLRRLGWVSYTMALGVMTFTANEVSTRDGLPVLQSGWLWTSSTFHESAMTALAFLVWVPQTLSARATYTALAGVSAFAIWNPFLFSDPGFNTVGPRLALVAVLVLGIAGSVAVAGAWRTGKRVLAAVLSGVLLLGHYWPGRAQAVPESWLDSRALLEFALTEPELEFKRDGVHVAEHGIQFLLRLKANLDARQAAPEVQNEVGEVWYWLRVDAQSRRFEEGYWIAPGWVQVSSNAVRAWLADASEAEKIQLLTKNWHLRPLVRLSVPGT